MARKPDRKPGKKSDIDYRGERERLDRQLDSGEYARVYLITGDQDYLRTENRNRICKALLGDGDAMNAACYTGDQFTVQEIIDLANTLPFLAERRVITIEDSWLFGRRAGEGDALTDYLPHMPETTHLVFVQREVDRTRRLYRRIKEIGTVIDCVTPGMAWIREWVTGKCRDAGMRITDEARDLLVNDAGEEPDLLLLQSEIDKVVSYCGSRAEVAADDVRTIGTVQMRDRIYDMMGAITSHNATEALAIYAELLQKQVSPQSILGLLVYNYNQLLQVGELRGRGTSMPEIAGLMHTAPYIIEKRVVPRLRGQTAAELIRALDDCLQIDLDYKSGRIDPQIAVEEHIIRSSSGMLSSMAAQSS